MNDGQKLFEYLLLLIVSSRGSALGYVSKQWEAGKIIRVSRLLFSILSSLFFLILLKTLAGKFGLDPEWTIILVGLCSWMGVEYTANLISKALQRLLGVIPIYVKDDEASRRANIKPNSVCDVSKIQRDTAPAGASDTGTK